MFSHLSVLPADPLFCLQDEFLASTVDKKVNGGVGIYSSPNGDPFVFPSVQKASQEFVFQPHYLSMRGDAAFCNTALEVLLSPGFSTEKLVVQQSCGGTHACRLFADLFDRSVGSSTLLVATPTWANHYNVFHRFSTQEFPHILSDGTVNVAGYIDAITHAPQKSVLLLHGGLTHNPTGKNLSLSDLKKVLQAAKKNGVFVFIDYAYFGFGESWEDDRKYLQMYLEECEECAIAISFSKNAAMYQHRTGMLMVQTHETKKVASHLENIVRESISNPPAFGSHIMNIVFKKYVDEWKKELHMVRTDIQQRRNTLAGVLPQKYEFLKTDTGMFSLLPLLPEQIDTLKNKCGIFLPQSGRINMGGIRLQDIDYLGESLQKVL